jgi:hypothetical protein
MTADARERVMRAARILVPGVAFGILLVLLLYYFQRGFIPGDALTYLAAGERLNAGHLLYALSPGDRPVDLNPPFWTVPFLSPPFMAVVWRPLAALPAEIGAYLWWLATIGSIAIVVAALMRRVPVRTGILVLVLAVPLTYEIGVGNVNALLLLAAVASWLLVRAGRRATAGVVAAVMVAAKITPLPLAAWVAGAGGRRGFAGVAVGLMGCGVVGLLGAGPDAHVEYVSIVRDTGTTGLSVWSPGWIVRELGVPDPIPTLVPTGLLVAGTVCAYLLARLGRPSAAFGVAILAWTFGSPVVNVNTPILLVSLLAPIAWPWEDSAVAQDSGVQGSCAIGDLDPAT